MTKLLHNGRKQRRMSLGTIQSCLSGQGRVENYLQCIRFLLFKSFSFTLNDMVVVSVVVPLRVSNDR